MRLFTIILFLIIIFTCCSDKPEIPESGVVNGEMLQSLVVDALSGSLGANRLLSGLIDDDFSGRQDFNQLKIDSFYLEGRTYFSIIIEYPNPELNLFAVYDQYLKFFLLDKSLNGNITARWKKLDDKNLILLSEKFISKENLLLERLTLYSITSSTANLFFRIFNKLEKEGNEYFQTITSITEDYILTAITGTSKAGLSVSADTFYCNTITGDYSSPNNFFYNFINDQVNGYFSEISNPQIIFDRETSGSPKLIMDKKGFVIGATKEWDEITNYVVKNNLKKPFAGFSYINKSLGASVSIIKLPLGSFAEQFLNVKFGDAKGTNYKIRSTEIITSGRKNIQYIEHNCEGQRYLLIFEAPKSNFDDNKTIYTTLITSFRIVC